MRRLREHLLMGPEMIHKAYGIIFKETPVAITMSAVNHLGSGVGLSIGADLNDMAV